MKEESFIREMLNPRNLKIKYSSISTLGTYLVLYISLLPFSNNILEIFFPEIKTTYIKLAESSASTVIWCLGMCIQSTLLLLVTTMKPYLISYVFPMFTSIYSSAFYFMYLIGKRPDENIWFFVYIILVVVLIIFTMHSIRTYLRVQRMKENAYLNSMKKRISIN